MIPKLLFATPAALRHGYQKDRIHIRTVSAQKPAHRPVCSAQVATTSSLRGHLKKIVRGFDLSVSESEEAFRIFLSGDISDVEAGAFLAALSTKGESGDEIAGAASVLRQEMVPVTLEGIDKTLDIVGTGGDGHDTVNISTAAAIVSAAAGCTVAKQGNRSASSRSGSADVLEALGVNIELDGDGVLRCLRDAGIGFMFAPRYHPAMKKVAKVRKTLGIPSIFNVIGPLLNPSGAKRVVLGVYSRNLLFPMAVALGRLNVEHGLVVHGAGLDEMSPVGPSEIYEVKGEEIIDTEFDPAEACEMPKCEIEDLKGSDAPGNAEIIRHIFEGKRSGPVKDAILLNAGAGCYAFGLDESIQAGVSRAREAVDSGEALRTLEKWVAASKRT